MENEKLTLSSPWVSYAKMIEELFGYDPEIDIVSEMNIDPPEITLKVNNAVKADAISQILPTQKDFGNVSLLITVKPANGTDTKVDIFRKAFNGNPALNDIITIQGVFNNPISYIEFVNTVVQYFDDKLDDPHGNESTLYEDIARKVFDDVDGIFFSTAVKNG